jgi:probable F420-dependent oxidoreductase
VSRRSPFAGGAELPKEYWHTVDPFVGLMAAAAATKNLKVGTGICLIIERDTIATAKAAATLDFLSGGRFLFGIGAGWNAEEMENHGTVFKTRYKKMREQVLAMKEIWTKDEPQFHGEFVNFDPIWSWPKPAQKPHPPIYIGGGGPTVVDRVLAYADGWFPQWQDTDLAARITELRAKADRYVPVQVLSVPSDPSVLEQLAAAGVDRVSCWLPSGPWSTVEPALEKWESAIGELVGR